MPDKKRFRKIFALAGTRTTTSSTKAGVSNHTERCICLLLILKFKDTVGRTLLCKMFLNVSESLCVCVCFSLCVSVCVFVFVCLGVCVSVWVFLSA